MSFGGLGGGDQEPKLGHDDRPTTGDPASIWHRDQVDLYRHHPENDPRGRRRRPSILERLLQRGKGIFKHN